MQEYLETLVLLKQLIKILKLIYHWTKESIGSLVSVISYCSHFQVITRLLLDGKKVVDHRLFNFIESYV